MVFAKSSALKCTRPSFSSSLCWCKGLMYMFHIFSPPPKTDFPSFHFTFLFETVFPFPDYFFSLCLFTICLYYHIFSPFPSVFFSHSSLFGFFFLLINLLYPCKPFSPFAFHLWRANKLLLALGMWQNKTGLLALLLILVVYEKSGVYSKIALRFTKNKLLFIYSSVFSSSFLTKEHCTVFFQYLSYCVDQLNYPWRSWSLLHSCCFSLC